MTTELRVLRLEEENDGLEVPCYDYSGGDRERSECALI